MKFQQSRDGREYGNGTMDAAAIRWDPIHLNFLEVIRMSIDAAPVTHHGKRDLPAIP